MPHTSTAAEFLDRPFFPEGMSEPDPEDPISGGFWAAAAEGRLVVQQCEACGQTQYPPELNCHACYGFELGWREVRGTGAVWSWVGVAHPAHPALREFGPYVVALIELDDLPGDQADGRGGGRRRGDAADRRSGAGGVRAHSGGSDAAALAACMSAAGMTAAGGGLSSRRRWAILIVLAGAQMLVQLDATIINTALPSIKRAFEMSESQALWVADAYFVIFGGLLLLAGALGDRFGRRKILVIGMALFAIASVGVAFSPNANWLIIGRGLQGLGGALVVPQTLSILTAVFPREERTRAFGIWAAAMGFGMAVGPFAGGVLIDTVGWAGVFWVPAPIALLAIIGCVAVPESRSQLHTKLDVPGAITGTIGMIALVFAIIEGLVRGWDSPVIIGSFIVAAVAWLLFVVIERRTAQPLLPMAFFRQRDFTGSMVGMFFIMFALMGVMFYMPQFFQSAQGVSATTSGLRMMPLALMMAFFAPVAAKLLPKVGPRLMLFWAPAVHGGGALLFFSFMQVDTPYWMIALGLAFLGMGGGDAHAGHDGHGDGGGAGRSGGQGVGGEQRGAAVGRDAGHRDFGQRAGGVLRGRRARGAGGGAARSGRARSGGERDRAGAAGDRRAGPNGRGRRARGGLGGVRRFGHQHDAVGDRVRGALGHRGLGAGAAPPAGRRR